jgi:hypothetical protein
MEIHSADMHVFTMHAYRYTYLIIMLLPIFFIYLLYDEQSENIQHTDNYYRVTCYSTSDLQAYSQTIDWNPIGVPGHEGVLGAACIQHIKHLLRLQLAGACNDMNVMQRFKKMQR